MKPSPPPDFLDDFDARVVVETELENAGRRLALDLPQMDGAHMLRLSIGYFAKVHAEHFGHAATVKMLLKIARRGLGHQSEQLSELTQSPHIQRDAQ